MFSEKRIIFGGIKKRNEIPYLVFLNDKGSFVEIPIEPQMAKHIELYLAKIAHSFKEEKEPVERGNEEEAI